MIDRSSAITSPLRITLRQSKNLLRLVQSVGAQVKVTWIVCPTTTSLPFGGWVIFSRVPGASPWKAAPHSFCGAGLAAEADEVMSEAPIERPSAASAKSLTNRFCNKRRTPAIEAAGLPLSLP
jgi:hypothetical protein